MLPDFLEAFCPQLEVYRLDYIKITATPRQPDETVSLLQSKFLGAPYLPVGSSYPLDTLGKHMILLAQINFAEVPALAQYPTHGILQLFVSATEWYNMEDYRILFYADTTEAAQTDFSFLTSELYEDSPIYVEHTLSFQQQTEYGGAADSRFEMDFAGKSYYDYQETLPQPQQEALDRLCYNTGHKLGGYAFFTQGDPREYEPGKRGDVLLLQIDTDEHIMFGDSGVAHVFISPEALANQQFDRAYFYWDCC